MKLERRGFRIGGAVIALCSVGALAACGNSGHPVTPIVGAAATATPTPGVTKTSSPTASPTAVAATPTATPAPTASAGVGVTCTTPTTSVPTTGGTVTADTGNFSEVFAAGAFAAATNVVLDDVTQANLPAPLARTRFVHVTRNGRQFTAGAGNTYVVAFCTNFFGATPATAPAVNGAAGIVPATIAVGTQLNIAMYNGTSYTDVGTAIVGTGGTFASSIPTATLPGISTSGTYLVYEPAQGTNTTQINLGFALVADDGTGNVANGLQYVQLEDNSGNALPTPTTTFFPVMGSDLDGQSLTPDAQEGAAVDGGSTVDFFSGIPQHAFNLSPTTVDVSAYGGDGDSIASLPNGDEAVVSADGGLPLAVISGILSGNPVVADTIPNPAQAPRDGLVISNDGKTLLSRGYDGIDVFQVAPVAAHAGSTGNGTTSYSFTQTTTLSTTGTPAIASPYGEDGRDEMAISPVDSTRAVIVGAQTSATTGVASPVIQLVTGLPGSATISSLHLHLPKGNQARPVRRDIEPSTHRKPFSLAPADGESELYAVTITPDGTTAYVSTDVGIITITGVNTGTLAEAGAPYSPSLTFGAGTTPCPVVSVSTIGILPDGKYLIADVQCGSTLSAPSMTTDSNQGSGVMLTIPIGANKALGAPVGQLNNVVSPYNDQMIVH